MKQRFSDLVEKMIEDRAGFAARQVVDHDHAAACGRSGRREAPARQVWVGLVVHVPMSTGSR